MAKNKGALSMRKEKRDKKAYHRERQEHEGKQKKVWQFEPGE
jgi:hypothetical protein